MLSIKPLTGGGGGDVHSYLAQGDYYSEQDRVCGEWFGKGAKMLGLSGQVHVEDFENIRQFNNPQTGQFLRAHHGKNNLYDLCFSAPKSVSIIARLGNDTRLDKAHQIAVKEALRQVERETVCKIQKDKRYGERKTDCLIAAVFMHDTSRELDPQLHSHCAVANMTFDAGENRWKAIHAGAIFERKAYFQQIYKNALARELVKLGYAVENRAAGRNGDHSFEIVGIDRSLCKKFSKMSDRIAKAVDQYIEKNGAAPSDREVGQLARSVRPDKMYEISKEEIEARQQAQLIAEEKAKIATVRAKAKANEGRAMEQADPKEAVAYALNHLLERSSVVTDFQITQQALFHARGKLTVEAIENRLQELRRQGTILRYGKEIATRESLNREKQMVWMVDQGVGKFQRLDRGKEFTHGRSADGTEKLNASQKNAVEFILASRDFVVNLQGAPGVGKTHTLHEVYRGLKEAGHDVLAVAPTRSAKGELKEIGIASGKTFTVEGLLQDHFAGEKMRGRTILLDEAGMVSNRQMFELLRLGHFNNSRFVFAGDSKQLQAVEAGDALRILEKESALKSRAHTVELTEIERQKQNPAYKRAIELMREQPQQAFDLLDAMGVIKEVPYLERPSVIADAVKGREGVLVVGSTHEENNRINRMMRVEGDSCTLMRMEALNWTEAERRDVRNFSEGDVLLFHRETNDGKVDNAYRVTGTKGRFVETVDLDGNKARFSQKQAKSFGVFRETEVEVSVGDKLIFNANCKRDGFECINGHQAFITSFDDHARPVLNTGETVPGNFFQFNLAYAITAHKSQGKTVDEVVVSADRMNRELFYVACSRARDQIMIFTRNKEELREAIGVSGERPTAMELERQCAQATGLNLSINDPSISTDTSEEAHARRMRFHAAERYREWMNFGHQQANDNRDLRDHSYTYATWLDQGREIGGRGSV